MHGVKGFIKINSEVKFDFFPIVKIMLKPSVMLQVRLLFAVYSLFNNCARLYKTHHLHTNTRPPWVSEDM